MELYHFIKQLHSGFRYIVLLLLVLALLRAFTGWFGKKSYSEGNRKLNLFTMISVHTQFLIGIVLYFLSPLVQFTSETMKNKDARYWTVEHIGMMLFAIILITIGHSRSKKIQQSEGKHRAIAIFYGLATLIAIIAIIQSGRGLLGMTS